MTAVGSPFNDGLFTLFLLPLPPSSSSWRKSHESQGQASLKNTRTDKLPAHRFFFYHLSRDIGGVLGRLRTDNSNVVYKSTRRRRDVAKAALCFSACLHSLLKRLLAAALCSIAAIMRIYTVMRQLIYCITTHTRTRSRARLSCWIYESESTLKTPQVAKALKCFVTPRVQELVIAAVVSCCVVLCCVPPRMMNQLKSSALVNDVWQHTLRREIRKQFEVWFLSVGSQSHRTTSQLPVAVKTRREHGASP